MNGRIKIQGDMMKLMAMQAVVNPDDEVAAEVARLIENAYVESDTLRLLEPLPLKTSPEVRDLVGPDGRLRPEAFVIEAARLAGMPWCGTMRTVPSSELVLVSVVSTDRPMSAVNSTTSSSTARRATIDRSLSAFASGSAVGHRTSRAAGPRSILDPRTTGTTRTPR